MAKEMVSQGGLMLSTSHSRLRIRTVSVERIGHMYNELTMKETNWNIFMYV